MIPYSNWTTSVVQIDNAKDIISFDSSFPEMIQLPRGHVEPRDKFVTAAIREFKEETKCINKNVQIFTDCFDLCWEDENRTWYYKMYVAYSNEDFIFDVDKRLMKRYFLKIGDNDSIPIILNTLSFYKLASSSTTTETTNTEEEQRRVIGDNNRHHLDGRVLFESSSKYTDISMIMPYAEYKKVIESTQALTYTYNSEANPRDVRSKRNSPEITFNDFDDDTAWQTWLRRANESLVEVNSQEDEEEIDWDPPQAKESTTTMGPPSAPQATGYTTMMGPPSAPQATGYTTTMGPSSTGKQQTGDTMQWSHPRPACEVDAASDIPVSPGKILHIFTNNESSVAHSPATVSLREHADLMYATLDVFDEDRLLEQAEGILKTDFHKLQSLLNVILESISNRIDKTIVRKLICLCLAPDSFSTDEITSWTPPNVDTIKSHIGTAPVSDELIDRFVDMIQSITNGIIIKYSTFSQIQKETVIEKGDADSTDSSPAMAVRPNRPSVFGLGAGTGKKMINKNTPPLYRGDNEDSDDDDINKVIERTASGIVRGPIEQRPPWHRAIDQTSDGIPSPFYENDSDDNDGTELLSATDFLMQSLLQDVPEHPAAVAAAQTEIGLVPVAATQTEVGLLPVAATQTEVGLVPVAATQTEVGLVPVAATQTEVGLVPVAVTQTRVGLVPVAITQPKVGLVPVVTTQPEVEPVIVAAVQNKGGSDDNVNVQRQEEDCATTTSSCGKETKLKMSAFKKALMNHESRRVEEEEPSSPVFEDIQVGSQPTPIDDISPQPIDIGSDMESVADLQSEAGDEMSKERFRLARKRKAARSAAAKNLPKKVKRTNSVKSLDHPRPSTSAAVNPEAAQVIADQTQSILTHYQMQEEVVHSKEIIQSFEKVVDTIQVQHWIQLSDYLYDRNLEHLTEQPIKKDDSLKIKFWKSTMMLLNKAYEDWRSTEESSAIYRKLKVRTLLDLLILGAGTSLWYQTYYIPSNESARTIKLFEDFLNSSALQSSSAENQSTSQKPISGSTQQQDSFTSTSYTSAQRKEEVVDAGSPQVYDPYPDMDTFYSIVDSIIDSTPAETSWPSSTTFVRRSETEGVSLSTKQESEPYFLDLKWYEKRHVKSTDSREMWRYAEFRSKHQYKKNSPIYRAIMTLQQAILRELKERGASSTLTSLKK
ncbi:hypothetical protein GE061_016760 [Apolygus lucorum]|uniref:Nudix hydrolase domain-containing protein n=1 Tax=Apolygus lucorum TaxID=248454 RepID=A0A8S9XJR3_APOLU|nr:hypothetical protein GE061_016760 [Apolygus lucorum]